MHVVASRPRSSRWFFALLFLLACGSTLASAQTTTFTGTVYSPLGPPVAGSSAQHGDPIPNILVFIADPNNPPPSFTQGLTIPAAGQNGCAAQPSLVPSTVLGEALTDANGKYTFATAGALPATVDVVIQAGKWRRQTSYPSSMFTLGGANTIPTLSMPASQADGDLPHIAVVTGSADQIECIFRQIGIQDSEITDPTGSGSINLFEGTSTGGEIVDAATPKEAQLLNPNATGAIPLTNYDLVMFGCQGSSGDQNAPLYASNLVPYTSDGGRIFTTHWEYIFLKDAPAFAGAATWLGNSVTIGTATATIDTSYPGGVTLAAWMQGLGALSNISPPEFSLMNVRQDTTAVAHPPSQSWGKLTSYTGNPSIQFTFDTPIGASGTPTVALSYTNNTTQFLRDTTGNTITITVTNNGNSPTVPGLMLTLSIPAAITPTSLVDSSGGAWLCTVGSPASTCNLPLALAAGASDSVLLTFNIPVTAPVGNASLNAALSGGGINNSGQCGRVLYNDYHVEEPNGSGTIAAGTPYNNGKSCPALVGNTLTSAQQFLEYSLYNLSNFVSPNTTDLLLIQSLAPMSWTPATSVYYGTLITDPSIDNATSTVAGTFAYTSTWNSTAPPDVGSYTVTATFTPTDTADYVGGKLTRTINVLIDPTTSTVDSLDQSIFYGQEIGYDNGVDAILNVHVIAPGYIGQAVNNGPFNVTIDGTIVCTGVEGQPINGGTRPGTCPDSGFLGWIAGTHEVQLTYSGDGKDFLGSQSPLYPVVINPDPTTTTFTTSSNPSVAQQTLTLNASVADIYTLAVGPVTFYDSATASVAGNTPVGSPIGSALLDANGNASLTTNTVFAGTHNLSACFTPPLNSGGVEANYLVSCSASIPQVVTLPIGPALATSTFVSSSANPSAVGQAVTFTATVATTGAFPAIPAGGLTFYDGNTSLNSTTLGAAGTATYTTSTLAAGSHPITAVYAGNSTISGSTSAILTQLVETPVAPAGTGFLLITGANGVSVPVGNIATVNVQILELSNFNQPVNLACTGLPAQSTCTFALSTMPAAGGTTVLSVQSAAPHNCNGTQPYFTASGNGVMPLLGLATLTLCLARRRKKLQGLALLGLLCLLPLTLTGCGAGNCTDFGLKPGTYSFTITATSTGTPVVVKTQVMSMNVHL